MSRAVAADDLGWPLRRWTVPARDIPDVAHNLLIELIPWAARCSSEELVAPFDRCRRYACAAAARGAWGHKRREARRGELLGWEPRGAESTGEPPAPDLSPEEMLLEREAAAERAAELDLDHLRQATTPACWRAFHAHWVDGTPVASIAEVEQLPVATVYNRIRIARRDLRAAILRRRAGAHRK